MSSPLSLKWSGGESMRDKLLKLQIDFDQTRIPAAMRIEAETIMTTSKRDHVPVDLGTLRGSGRVGKVIKLRKDFSITMSYGGAASAYALAIHEHLSSHSPPSWKRARVKFNPAGRGPKYLERPIRDAASSFADNVAQRLRV